MAAQLTWNITTNQILLSNGLGSASFEATRGSTMLQLLLVSGADGATPVLLASDQMINLVVCDPDNLGEGYLGGPVTGTRGATAADGYLFTLSTDTDLTRALMQVDDPANPELPVYPASAVFVQVPTVGDPTPSLPFNWSILAAYYRTTTPPADIVAQWDSPEQLHAAIAQAASAEPRLPVPTAENLVLFGHADGTKTFGALPTSYVDFAVTGTASLAALTVSGASSLASLVVSGATSLTSLAVSGAATVTGNLTAGTLTGNGGGVTNLTAAAIVGVLSTANLPASVLGALEYQGAWDARANNPPLASSQGTKGFYYTVSVAGTTYLDGISQWAIGDKAAFNGVSWEKFEGVASEVNTVDGVAPVGGNVALLADQGANVASKRTLGTGAQQAAPGNDTRFPTTFPNTGGALVFRSTTGNTDRPAVAGTDFLAPTGDGSGLTNLPFQPVSSPTPVAPTFAVYNSSIYVSGSVTGNAIRGRVSITLAVVNGSAPSFQVGDIIASITLTEAVYRGRHADPIWVTVTDSIGQRSVDATSSLNGSGVPVIVIKAAVAIHTAATFVYDYFVPVY